MKFDTKIQASLIFSLIGFFIGGIINIKKDIIEIFISSIIGLVICFFIFFIIINIIFKEEVNLNEKDLGKNIDIMINDTDEIINNYLKK